MKLDLCPVDDVYRWHKGLSCVRELDSPDPPCDAWEEPDAEDGGDPGFEHHSWDEDVEPVMQGLAPGHGVEVGVDRVDPVEPGDAEEEDDHVDRDPGGEDRAPPADGFVFAFHDPVRDGLAEEEPEEVPSGLPEEDGEPGLSVAENTHADGAHEEIERHTRKAQTGPERHGAQEYAERLEGDGNPERRGRDRDVRADDDDECHHRHRREAPEQTILGVIAYESIELSIRDHRHAHRSVG